MRLWRLMLCVAALAAPAVAGAQSAEQTYKAAGARASRPTATIAYGSDSQQFADLRLPKGKGPFPVAVVVHGGCWTAKVDGNKGIAGMADALTQRGFATWNIEYRRIGNAGGGWPGTFQDVAAAVDKLADIAGKYPLDLKRVTIVGHSSGAHLALWAASRARLPAPWTGTKIKPVSVVAIDGPAALAPFIGIDKQACDGTSVIVPLMGGTPQERPEAYAIATPADHLPLGLRQIWVGADFAPLLGSYIAAARKSGDTVDLFEPGDANHFDIVTPDLPNGKAVLDFIAAKALVPAPPPEKR